MFDDLVSWITEPQRLAVITFLSAAVAILAAIVAVAMWFGRQVQSRLQRTQRERASEVTYHRITHVDDPDLTPAIAMHHRRFPDTRLTGVRNDLRRWIAEYEQQVLTGEEIEWDEQLIVAKKAGNVVGYLYASFHRPTRYVFMSYFGTENTFDSYVNGIRHVLLEGLLEHIAKADLPPWGCSQEKFKAIIGELDLKKNRGQGRREAFLLADYFGELAYTAGYDAYMIDGLEYDQPMIDLDDIRKNWRPGIEVPTAGKQILLYIPSVSLGNVYHISKAEAEDIIRFIIMKVYPDSYDTCDAVWEEYMRYASDLYSKQRKSIPERVQITALAQRPASVRPFVQRIADRTHPALSGH